MWLVAKKSATAGKYHLKANHFIVPVNGTTPQSDKNASKMVSLIIFMVFKVNKVINVF